MIYSNFAYIYDKLMYDVDYIKWANYIEDIFRQNGIKPELVADIACGTGNFAIEMSTRGYDMIGIDISVDMLNCAKEKSQARGQDILFLCQDMTDFELYGTVDAIVCLMDSVNYITSKRDLNSFFKLVKNYLNPSGIFIFDINTPYKFEKKLENNVFYDIGDDITYIWQNNYDRKKKLCEFDLTFFVKEGDSYKRYEETHIERSYLTDELKTILEKTGLKLIGIYDELEFSKPSKKSERVFFVSKKGAE